MEEEGQAGKDARWEGAYVCVSRSSHDEGQLSVRA